MLTTISLRHFFVSTENSSKQNNHYKNNHITMINRITREGEYETYNSPEVTTLSLKCEGVLCQSDAGFDQFDFDDELKDIF